VVGGVGLPVRLLSGGRCGKGMTCMQHRARWWRIREKTIPWRFPVVAAKQAREDRGW